MAYVVKYQLVDLLRIPQDGSSPKTESVPTLKTNSSSDDYSLGFADGALSFYVPDVREFWEGGDFEKRKLVSVIYGGDRWYLLFSRDPALGAHPGIEPANYLFGDAFLFRVLNDKQGHHDSFQETGEHEWPFPDDKARKVLQIVAENRGVECIYHLQKDYSWVPFDEAFAPEGKRKLEKE